MKVWNKCSKEGCIKKVLSSWSDHVTRNFLQTPSYVCSTGQSAGDTANCNNHSIIISF